MQPLDTLCDLFIPLSFLSENTDVCDSFHHFDTELLLCTL